MHYVKPVFPVLKKSLKIAGNTFPGNNVIARF